jgi:hypothetical protein
MSADVRYLGRPTDSDRSPAARLQLRRRVKRQADAPQAWSWRIRRITCARRRLRTGGRSPAPSQRDLALDGVAVVRPLTGDPELTESSEHGAVADAEAGGDLVGRQASPACS